MSIGDNIKYLREERNYSQRELAKVLNITPGTVSKYEKGTNQVPIDMLASIADVFGVSIDYLVGRTSMKRDMSVLDEKYSRYDSVSQFLEDALNLSRQGRDTLCEVLLSLKCRNSISKGEKK